MWVAGDSIPQRRRLAGPATFCRIWKATFRYYQPNTSTTTTRCKADWTMLPMKMADCLSIVTLKYSLFYYSTCDSLKLKNAPRLPPSLDHGPRVMCNVFHGLVAYRIINRTSAELHYSKQRMPPRRVSFLRCRLHDCPNPGTHLNLRFKPGRSPYQTQRM